MTVAEELAPSAEVAAHPAVTAARRLAADLLSPYAELADLPHPAGGVPRAHVDALAAAGLLSVTTPVADGGLGASPAVEREVVETLAGACGATWFVVTQHRLPQALVAGRGAAARPDVRDRWSAPLATGRALAGVVVAHVRRPGPPAVRVRRDADSWVFDGRATWCTSWGLADAFVVVGQTEDDRLVLALVPGREQPGMTPTAALPLVVMAGTRTVGLDLDGYRVPLAGDPDRAVLDVVDRAAWLEADTARTANVVPAAVGLLRRVLVELEATGERRGEGSAVDAAHALAAAAAPARARAYQLLDEAEPGDALAERTALRARLGELTVRSAGALVAAQAGSALLTTAPVQRWAREALFHLVQAQTAPVRAAQLWRAGMPPGDPL